MATITITISEKDITSINYTSNNDVTYPICTITTNSFDFDKTTNKDIIILVSNFIHQIGLAFRNQLITQNISNNTLNKRNKAK